MKIKNIINYWTRETKSYSDRLFLLNLPLFIVLLFLVVFEKLSPLIAIGSFFCAFLLSWFFVFPWVKHLEKVRNQIQHLLQWKGEEDEFHPDFTAWQKFKNLFEQSGKVNESIQQFKYYWRTKTHLLEVQTMTDAAIIDNLPDPVLMIDEQKVIVFENKRVRDLFGNRLVGKNISEFMKEEGFLNYLDHILLKQKAQEFIEISLGDFTFRVRIEALPSQTKENAVALIVLHDITFYKQLEQSQIDFFANASHELKTPLSVLMGLIETLEGPAKDDPKMQEKFLKMMGAQIGRMSKLVQDLLAISKLHSPVFSVERESILIPELLRSVKVLLENKASKKQMEIRIKYLHEMPLLKGNTDSLFKAFQNLVDNAIKYGEEGMPITITASLRNGFPKKFSSVSPSSQVVAVEVHNFGDVIEPEKISRLEERFYRATNKTDIPGTGLGLGIVKQIVLQHDGEIEISSSEKIGTKFIIYLPVGL
ncbi:MAG: ATP-binding protein [Alphaproteobacteria bacterium]|nr:ATP-binding protein [Alphaproteobacteria bacterium]